MYLRDLYTYVYSVKMLSIIGQMVLRIHDWMATYVYRSSHIYITHTHIHSETFSIGVYMPYIYKCMYYTYVYILQ